MVIKGLLHDPLGQEESLCLALTGVSSDDEYHRAYNTIHFFKADKTKPDGSEGLAEACSAREPGQWRSCTELAHNAQPSLCWPVLLVSPSNR